MKTDTKIYYKADNPKVFKPQGNLKISLWKSPRFMPRWASRIDLEITGIKVERLQEITIDGLYAEGWDCETGPDPADWFKSVWDKMYFKSVWDKMYAKKPEYQWAQNPWCWVYSFKRVKREEKERILKGFKCACRFYEDDQDIIDVDKTILAKLRAWAEEG